MGGLVQAETQVSNIYLQKVLKEKVKRQQRLEIPGQPATSLDGSPRLRDKSDSDQDPRNARDSRSWQNEEKKKCMFWEVRTQMGRCGFR